LGFDVRVALSRGTHGESDDLCKAVSLTRRLYMPINRGSRLDPGRFPRPASYIIPQNVRVDSYFLDRNLFRDMRPDECQYPREALVQVACEIALLCYPVLLFLLFFFSFEFCSLSLNTTLHKGHALQSPFWLANKIYVKALSLFYSII